ncbi:hypothetical protein [Sporisorium scitamineum]|uniref:Uncharacterized protein n=1 Tax=Sporisorium scitamineum TaxID=49012 RepID=A0A0F7SDE5_9BASI|nr:hypothetical protein [Sporisorium scitamineum]
MSGGPQHPFHNQSNQHDYSYPPFSSAPSQSPPVYGHNNAAANYQHSGAFHQHNHPQSIASHGNFFPTSDASYPGVYGQPTARNQFGVNQSYPAASSAFSGDFAHLVPDSSVGGADFQGHPSFSRPGNVSAQHLQQVQPDSVAQFPLKQTAADLELISTPPLPSIDSTTSSPQKPGLRIKLKRTFKAQESSSGGQQAQAQLQIDPSAISNMPVGRPTRSAATAASANIHNSFSDSPASRSLRNRQVKQQPGSEEDYEETCRDVNW